MNRNWALGLGAAAVAVALTAGAMAMAGPAAADPVVTVYKSPT